MDNDLRYAFPCRLALLAASAVHWVAAAAIIFSDGDASAWELSPDVEQLAVAIVELVIGG